MNLAYEKPIKKRKPKLEEEDDDQPTNGMQILPHEIAIDILSRLPMTSLIQFRFVCQAWHKLSYDPHLVNLHLSRAINNNPSLIFHCDYPIQNQLYFIDLSADHDDKNIVRKIQIPFSASMAEFNVVGSCNGLLCLSDSLFGDALYIYNPFTRQHKELPKSIQFEQQEVMFGFGFHPCKNEYKLVKIIYYSNPYNANNRPWRYRRFRIRDFPHSMVQILSLRTNTWRNIGKMPYQLERRSSEAFINGRLHWVSRVGKYHGSYGRLIVAFDLSVEKFLEIPRPECLGLIRRNYYLAVLGGCLCVVVPCRYSSLEVWVMKNYDVKESWIKEYSIAAHLPKSVSEDLQHSYGIWKNVLNRRIVRILCILKNGKILVEYRGRNLVSYDPESETFDNLVFEGMPNLFQTVVHVGSLNWIDIPSGT